MKIEILWAMFLVTTAFGAVVARDIPSGPDLQVDDLMISREENVMDYSNYTIKSNANRQLGTCIGGNVQCIYNGQYLPHPSPGSCNKYCQCIASSATSFTPMDMNCSPGTTWFQSNKGCIHPPTKNCAKIAPVFPPVTPKPPVSCSCGTSKHIKRIIGGVEVTPWQKYPWQVGLRTPGQKDDIECGGSIINNRYVLTAAHCVYEHEHGQTFVHIGEHDMDSTVDDSQGNTRVIGVKTKIIHPCYDCLKFDFDFALLELDDVIVFNDVITPVCLPEDDSKTYVGEKATVAGWGNANNVITNTLYYPDKLREVDVTILDNTNCGIYDIQFGTGAITSNMLCAGDLGKDICDGDSGGPLVVKDPKKVGKTTYVQVGVVSFNAGICPHPLYPGVYARVSKVLDWIKENTASGQYCDN